MGTNHRSIPNRKLITFQDCQIQFELFKKVKKKTVRKRKWWEKRKSPPTEKRPVLKHWPDEDQLKLLPQKRESKSTKTNTTMWPKLAPSIWNGARKKSRMPRVKL